MGCSGVRALVAADLRRRSGQAFAAQVSLQRGLVRPEDKLYQVIHGQTVEETNVTTLTKVPRDSLLWVDQGMSALHHPPPFPLGHKRYAPPPPAHFHQWVDGTGDVEYRDSLANP